MNRLCSSVLVFMLWWLLLLMKEMRLGLGVSVSLL